MANLLLSLIVVVLILGGPFTLYALIKILLSSQGAPKIRFVKTSIAEGQSKPLALLVEFDSEMDIEISRIKIDFYELVRGGRSTSFSFTFQDKQAKKRNFLIPMQLKARDYEILTDAGLSSQPRSLKRSYASIEIEDPRGETVRIKVPKTEIRAALISPDFVPNSEIEVCPLTPPDAWSVLTRVFPWRQVVEEVAAAPTGAHGAAQAADAPKKEVDFAVTKVWIEPGCIVCDACENEAPLVFHVLADTCIVRENAPLDDAASIAAAAEGCPVDVIKYTKVAKTKVA